MHLSCPLRQDGQQASYIWTPTLGHTRSRIAIQPLIRTKSHMEWGIQPYFALELYDRKFDSVDIVHLAPCWRLSSALDYLHLHSVMRRQNTVQCPWDYSHSARESLMGNEFLIGQHAYHVLDRQVAREYLEGVPLWLTATRPWRA